MMYRPIEKSDNKTMNNILRIQFIVPLQHNYKQKT